jgi:hypothetical protein
MKRIRISLGAFALLVSMLASGSTASAGVQWCEEDPEFLVNGAVVDVTTWFDGSYASSVNGAVNFDMQVPSNVVAAVLSLPGTVPVTAQISRTLPAYYGIGKIPVVVTVSMKASQTFTTTTTITGLGGALASSVSGDSKQGTKAKFSMYGL